MTQFTVYPTISATGTKYEVRGPDPDNYSPTNPEGIRTVATCWTPKAADMLCRRLNAKKAKRDEKDQEQAEAWLHEAGVRDIWTGGDY